MGHNAFFAFTVCGVLGYSWQQALAAVFLSGVLFTALAAVGFRAAIVDAMPTSLKQAIAAGIGLLITLLGLEWEGSCRRAERRSSSWATCVARRWPSRGRVSRDGRAHRAAARGAILFGLVGALATAWWLGLAPIEGIVQLPPSLAPTAFHMDLAGLAQRGPGVLAIVFVFFLTDLFDTVGPCRSGRAGGPAARGRLPGGARAPRGCRLDRAGRRPRHLDRHRVRRERRRVAAGGRTGLTAVTTGSSCSRDCPPADRADGERVRAGRVEIGTGRASPSSSTRSSRRRSSWSEFMLSAVREIVWTIRPRRSPPS